MNILVTGASGFVGGAIARYLRQRGHHVTGLSRRPPRSEAADRAVLHDLAHPAPECGPFDVVVHAAALSAPWGRPAAFDTANIHGTSHALAIAALSGARFILISSSSVLYAPGDQQDLLEEPAPATRPVNDYARSKRAAVIVRRRAPERNSCYDHLALRMIYHIQCKQVAMLEGMASYPRRFFIAASFINAVMAWPSSG